MQEVKDENFQEEVLLDGGWVLVDYAADWCGPCQQMKPVLDDIATMFSGRVKVVQMNVDSNQEIPSQYGVRALPTLMLFYKGEKQDVRVGALNKKQLIDWLDDCTKLSGVEH